MEYSGKDHAVFFRHLAKAIREAIDRQKDFIKQTKEEAEVEQFLKEWEENEQQALLGSLIVIFIANIEKLIGKNSNNQWNLPKNWYGKREFNNFRKIRHCYAHAAGKVLPNLNNDLYSFYQDLHAGLIKDRSSKIVDVYYELRGGQVFLFVNIADRLRLLSSELLIEKGLIEKPKNWV